MRRSPLLAERDALVERARPAPRYTSYPPATEMRDTYTSADAAARLGALEPGAPVSLYAHIPYCPRLCWYCGCNVVVTRDRSRGTAYVDTLCREIARVGELASRAPLTELALGGGSPNFLAPNDLARLVAAVRDAFAVDDGAIFGVELDPRETPEATLDALAGLGFRRVSVGVQDFSPEVQELIHREQSFETTARVIEGARRRGFTETNIDLVYGLPGQTAASLEDTIETVLSLAPDQVALFGYAHLPQRFPHQKLVERRTPVPGRVARAELLLRAHACFERHGYMRIGLDHFARPDAPLVAAALDGNLARTFQGYVVRRAAAILGVGASGISDLGDAYWQSCPDVSEWTARVEAGELPVARGMALDRDDLVRRHVIERLMCDAELDFAEIDRRFDLVFETYFAAELAALDDPAFRDLVDLDRGARFLAATHLGTHLIRNVALVFDRYNGAHLTGTGGDGRPRFSMSV